jgi:hypothetical protein
MRHAKNALIGALAALAVVGVIWIGNEIVKADSSAKVSVDVERILA